jgi:competence protein ComEC
MRHRFAKDPDCSLVIEMSYNKISLLTLGENTRRHQQMFWDEVFPRPWGQVISLGRNGGEGAILPSILKPLKTKVAIIPIPRSSGARPAASTLQALKQAGVKVYRTDRDGAITVTTDGTDVSVTTERGG